MNVHGFVFKTRSFSVFIIVPYTIWLYVIPTSIVAIQLKSNEYQNYFSMNCEWQNLHMWTKEWTTFPLHLNGNINIHTPFTFYHLNHIEQGLVGFEKKKEEKR